jgi:hypothetical protein
MLLGDLRLCLREPILFTHEYFITKASKLQSVNGLFNTEYFSRADIPTPKLIEDQSPSD